MAQKSVKMFTGQTRGAASRVQAADSKTDITDGRMGRSPREELCGHHVLIWIWSTGQRVRMTIHGAPLSLSLCSFSPPCFERACQPSSTHTYTDFLAHVHTKEDGLKHAQESCTLSILLVI